MKSLTKFFSAALAVVALASCSDNDLISQKSVEAVAQDGDLIVTVDPLEEGTVFTRAFRDADAKKLVWAEGDMLNVYDADLYKHDVYLANAAGKFEVDGTALLQSPQYALFPGEDVVRGYWKRESSTEGNVYAEFKIPDILVYDEKCEKVIDATNKTVGYAANLPMWGTATKDGDQVKAHLRYLTAVLKIKLKNAFGNANWLVLRSRGTYTGGVFAYDAGYDAETAPQLSGTFRAKLDATGAPNAFTDDTKSTYTAFGETHLEVGESDLKTSDCLYIDLRKVPSQASCIYVPVIEGMDGDLDHISLAYSAATDDDPTLIATWTEIGCKFPNEEFKHNKLYETSWDFELENASPNALSAMLNQYKGTEDDITFDIVKTFGITNDNSIYNASGEIDPDGIDISKYGYTVAVPALKEGVDVTINLTKSPKTGGPAFTAWNNTPVRTLVFTDVDPMDPFTGTITFNVGEYANKIGVAQKFAFDFAEANVVIVGDYTTMTAAGELQILNAKTVTIGNGNATNATVLYAGTNGLQISDGTTVGNLGAVDNFVMAANAFYAGNLTTTEIATNITISGVGDATTPIAAALVGDIDMTATPKGKLLINGTPKANDDKAIDGTVTTKGDVEIALGAEGEAISTLLEMQGANHNLILKSGLVKEFKVDCVSTAGQWEQRYVNVKLDQIVNANSVACFPTLTTANDSYIKLTESLWSGKKIANAAYATFTTVDASDKYIYTASQLATVSANSIIYVGADMNLNEKNWTGNAIQKRIIGADLSLTRVTPNDDNEYPIIKNLTLASGNNGLFKETAGDLVISNLSIENLKIGATVAGSNVGGFIGTVKGGHEVTLENVAVNSAIAAGSGKNLNVVGGLVGLVDGALNLKKATATGSIIGYHSLGGFVGAVGVVPAAVDIDKDCTSSVNISTNYDSGKAMDLNYAKIGGFVGTTAGNITLAATVAEPTGTLTHNTAKEYMSDVSETTGNFYDFAQDQKYLGYSGRNGNSFASGSLKKGTGAGQKTYVVPNLGTNNKKGNPATNLGANEISAYHFTAK